MIVTRPRKSLGNVQSSRPLTASVYDIECQRSGQRWTAHNRLDRPIPESFLATMSASDHSAQGILGLCRFAGVDAAPAALELMFFDHDKEKQLEE